MILAHQPYFIFDISTITCISDTNKGTENSRFR